MSISDYLRYTIHIVVTALRERSDDDNTNTDYPLIIRRLNTTLARITEIEHAVTRNTPLRFDTSGPSKYHDNENERTLLRHSGINVNESDIVGTHLINVETETLTIQHLTDTGEHNYDFKLTRF